MMLLPKKDLKRLLKQIARANRNRSAHEPMIEFTLLYKNDSGTSPGRICVVSGMSPVSFWKSRQAAA